MQFIEKKTCKTWSQYARFIEKEQSKRQGYWIYRGDVNKSLKTSIERISKRWQIPSNSLPEIELRIIRDFQRKYPKSAPHPFTFEDTFWWLSMMRHHGAPTRLLDWTYSGYVAAYFALEKMLMNGKRKGFVWIIGRDWIDKESQKIITIICKKLKCDANEFIQNIKDSQPHAFKQLFIDWRPKDSFVCVLNPWHLHERLSIQQGIFLCPVNITKSFEYNISKMNNYKKEVQRISFDMSVNDIYDALENLNRMNINHATLFSGLDGYAHTFNTRLKFFYEDCNQTKIKHYTYIEDKQSYLKLKQKDNIKTFE